MLAPAAQPVLWDTALSPLLRTGADALESQRRRKKGGIFTGAFYHGNS